MMVKQHISQALRSFIKEKIQTVLRLEVVLLLHDHRYRSFSVAEVASELDVENETTKDQLTALEAIGLVAQSDSEQPRYSYRPRNATLSSMVEQLAADYPRQRVPILSVILAQDPDRTRRFAEAFRMIRRNN